MGEGERKIKILGINASPRKYGNTFKLLKVAMDVAASLGAETEIIHLYDYDIKPCKACLSDNQDACRPPCLMEDDAWTVLNKIKESDGLIIATPIYWYAPSGHLKNLIDKLTVFENMAIIEQRSWVEGKAAGFIATGGDSGAIMTIAYMMVVLNSMGFIIPPWALAYYEGMDDALDKESSVSDAANVGRVVTLAARSRPQEFLWYDPGLLDKLGGDKYLSSVKKIAEANKESSIGLRQELVRKMLSIDSNAYR